MPTDYRKRMVQFYDAAARLYDLTEFCRKGTRDAIVHASNCKSGNCVLDICTGTGEVALAFARHGVRATAVDLAYSMLRVGKRKSSFEHLLFLQADATRLPFPNKSFDVVTVSLALHHMPETAQIDVMKEMTRLARKKVIMVEYYASQSWHWQASRGLFIQLLDKSEYTQEWMHQDFSGTCSQAGLEVEREEVLTMGFHRMTICRPLFLEKQ